jgi:hypothetical protein
MKTTVSMKTTRILAFAAASALVLAVSACTSPTAEPSPSASDSPTPMPSPVFSDSPTPLPSPVDPVALDCPTWDDGFVEDGPAPIAANRYAGICAGMSFAEASMTYAGPPLVGVEFCPWITQIVAQDDPGLYVEAVSDPGAPGDDIFMFRMTWLADPATASSYEMPRTAEGITIGSTSAEVLAAYPVGSSIVFDDMALGPRDQIVVPVTSEYTYVFDVTDGLVNTMYWGENLSAGATAELCAL